MIRGVKSGLCAIGLAALFAASSVTAGPIADKAAEAERLLEAGDPTAALTLMGEALELAWDAAPLTVRKALFVDEANGYGLYVARDAKFKQGEKLLIYVEPESYGYGRTGAGSYSIGFDVDFILTDPDNNTLFAKDDFVEVASPVRYKNREFFLSLTVSLTGFPTGEFLSKFRLRDKNSDKSAIFELPFSVVE